SGDATVGEIAAPYPVSVQAVSKHLKVLEDAGVVSRSAGHRSPVHLEADVLDLMTAWIERYRRDAEARYRRLDGVLASMPTRPGHPPRGDERCPRPPPRPPSRSTSASPSCASRASSPRRPPTSSAPTSTPTSSRGGTARATSRCGSSGSTAGPAART